MLSIKMIDYIKLCTHAQHVLHICAKRTHSGIMQIGNHSLTSKEHFCIYNFVPKMLNIWIFFKVGGI